MPEKITIGDATFYHGDCIPIMNGLNPNVDLIVTDPPYLISYKTSRRKDKNHEFCSTIQGDNDPQLISEFLRISQQILKENSAIYVFCSQDKVDFFKQQIETRFNIKNMIIWVKNNHTAGDLTRSFGKQYEIIFLANKGKRDIEGKRITDVWDFRRVSGKWQYHQNEKPVYLIQQCIEKSSNRGDIVFDPFMGSGTTAVASYRSHRKFIGIEKEKKYFDIAVDRYRREITQLRICDLK